MAHVKRGGQRLIVAGAGPVGMVAALAAARAGFDVAIYDAAPDIDTSPRAATTHPSTLEMLAELGLYDRFRAQGLVARTFQFWNRGVDGLELAATFDHVLLQDVTSFPFVVQTEQHKLARLCRDDLAEADIEVEFGTSVALVEQRGDHVVVAIDRGRQRELQEAEWVIAADGGRSASRKALAIDFEGYTWPERFLVLTVADDFALETGCCYRNYVAGDEWANLFKVAGEGGHGRWRAVFPVGADERDEDALHPASAQRRLAALYPLGRDYALIHSNVYRVHQRVASTFRSGRVLLAGDAAHVNNPIGGLGLNFGIHDAVDAVRTLSSVAFGGQDHAALDAYSRRRRDLNIRFVQEQTVLNKKRLEEKDPVARRKALERMRAIADDPVAAKGFLMRSSLIDSVRAAAQIS